MVANPIQKFQDWITQQWVIVTGNKIDKEEFSWLIGPFGERNEIGDDFVKRLAKQENLDIHRKTKSQGLLSSINQLNLSKEDLERLSYKVVNFYEKTSEYCLKVQVKWNPFFKVFAYCITFFFSKRLNQLNIPLQKNSNNLTNEIIKLISRISNEIKYTIWLRSSIDTKQIIYSGIYSTCILPSGKTCIKAVFPLPQGNATVIFIPSVGSDGELILTSHGNILGEAGFYFLLKDWKNNYWAKFISSFRDKLIVRPKENGVEANQKLTLWNFAVLEMHYDISENIS